MRDTSVERVYEMVEDWEEELKQDLIYYVALIAVNFFVWGFIRLALGYAISGREGLDKGLSFAKRDYTLETIIVTVVVALVVAAAVGSRGPALHAGEARAQANLLALSLIARFIALLYPTYFVFFISFSPISAFKNPDELLRILISIVIGAILTVLATVIKEIEIFRWKERKRKEEERNRFLEQFRAEQQPPDDPKFFCERVSRKDSWVRDSACSLTLVIIDVLLAYGFLKFGLPVNILCLILLIIVFSIQGARLHMWIAKNSEVVWGLQQEEKKFFKKQRKLKRYRTGGTPGEYTYFLFMAGLVYIFLLTAITLFLIEDLRGYGGFWVVAGVLTIFLLVVSIAVCYNASSVFRFTPFPYIEEGRVNQESTEIYMPQVGWWGKIFFPAGYRVFALERTCDILNGKRVPRPSENHIQGKSKDNYCDKKS